MRPSTLAELAENYGMQVPTVRGFGSFTDFADMYLAACDVLRTPEDLARLCTETVLDGVEAGAVYIEPSFYLPHHNERLGPDEAVLEIVLDAFDSAGREHGMPWGLMLASDRTEDPALAVAQARLAVQHADRGIVSFGLANDESLGPPEDFVEAYRIIRDGGLLSTPHAGELAGPESVRTAIDVLGANRLQHGVRSVEDPDLVARLADEGICCDVCPTSNVLLSVFPDLASHPLGALIDAGVPCSINGDDPLLFGPGLLEEYELCRAELGLTDAQLAAAAMASLEHSGAPDEVRRAGLEGIAAWLRA
jgi:adenosine deaminase